VTVKLDKTAPTITGSTTGTAGLNGWFTSPVDVTFACSDTFSGIAACLADGTTADSRTVSTSGSVGGTATDNAGNSASASVPVKIDTTGPVVSGAPTTSPNPDGWYRDDVTVHWTATDPESRVPTAPANTTITGEGTGLTSSTTVLNDAGLSTNASSSPAVKIDRTAPTTSITGTPSNAWTNGAVTLALSASDNLSGVDRTFFTVDGGADTSGTSIALSTQGDHTITYWSVDKAGNVETAGTVHVRIDKTAPTIGHGFSLGGYHDNDWTNSPVTVTFTCADQGGGRSHGQRHRHRWRGQHRHRHRVDPDRPDQARHHCVGERHDERVRLVLRRRRGDLRLLRRALRDRWLPRSRHPRRRC
jgi:hypothetical protein